MFGPKCCISKGLNQCGNVDSEFLIELWTRLWTEKGVACVFTLRVCSQMSPRTDGAGVSVPTSGSGFSLVFLRIFTHASVIVRFYAHRHRPDGDPAERSLSRTMEPQRGPAAGWGSILCCWSGCHITPCGDDCAIYCLAGAGDRRRWSRTGPEKMSKFLKWSFNLTSSGLVLFSRQGECVQAWSAAGNWAPILLRYHNKFSNIAKMPIRKTPNRLLVSCGSREVWEIWLKIKYFINDMCFK